MRILAIRGQNLASLGAHFEIDLTAEPLSSAGLFAITGDTGAGKSTILDALCLALYGDYPRVDVQQREDVPDPSGKAIQASDARAILRRGAGHGFAEIDFAGIDGIAYRARWAVARARGTVTGALQKPQRLLTRIADGQAIAEGITPVAEAVVLRTGLNFQQFRRSVLLAQGEFDRFLVAADNDRAELLEKITGTEVYARLSKRVHAGWKERREAIERLEEQHRAIGLMEVEERATLAAAAAAVETEIKAGSDEAAALSASMNTARRAAEARAQVAAAELTLTGEQARSQAAAKERSHLEALETVEPLRSAADAESRARERAAEVTEEVKAALLNLEAAKRMEDAARATHDDALARTETLERRRIALEPVWQEAKKCDVEIGLALAELEKAKLAAAAADTERDTATFDHTALKADVINLRDHLKDIDEEITRNGAHRLLVERRKDIAEAAVRWRQRSGDKVAADHAANEAKLAIKRLATSQQDRLALLEAGKERRAEHFAMISDVESALVLLDVTRHRARDVMLAGLEGILREAQPQVTRRARAMTDWTRAETAAQRAFEDMQATVAELASHTFRHAGLLTRRQEIGALVALVDATRSPEAVALRETLLPDAPCPVCGGADHPYAHPDHAEATLVAEVRARRQALDDEIAAAEHAIRDHKAHQVESGARREQAQRNSAEAAHDLQDAVHHLQSLDRTWRSAAASVVGAPTFVALPDAMPDAIGAALTAVEFERRSLASALAHAAELNTTLEALRAEDRKLARSLEHEAEAAADETHERHSHELVLQSAADKASALAADLTKLHSDLAPALNAGHLSATDWERDPDATARHLWLLADAFADAEDRRSSMVQKLRAAEAQQAILGERTRNAQSDAEHAAAAVAERTTALGEVTNAREALLGGETVDAHRARHVGEQREALAGLAIAQQEKVDTAIRLGAAAVRSTTAAQLQDKASIEFAQASARLATMAAATNIGLAEVRRLLAEPVKTRTDLALHLEQLSRSVTDARASLKARQEDLTRLLETCRDAAGADIAALIASHGILSARIDQLRDRRAEILARLAQDDGARARATDVADLIAAARSEFGVWDPIYAAIGDANGDKFRRFAQRVTLEELVRLANVQLQALAPRYRLAKGATSDLALSIVDRDMGDELRSVRSLSGGERFLASLGLALALSGLEGRQSFVDTLFIDEGFGTLDAETLAVVIEALERLQGSGRKVGVITHVAAMTERIVVQVRVEARGAGRSVVRIIDRTALPLPMAS